MFVTKNVAARVVGEALNESADWVLRSYTADELQAAFDKIQARNKRSLKYQLELVRARRALEIPRKPRRNWDLEPPSQQEQRWIENAEYWAGCVDPLADIEPLPTERESYREDPR
ncbi:MAG: hypothetical protein M0R06_00780 [Sphaerochaeta sp.]|jgi:hypothetical protein|nr:hypothetical protein [Sphaerochaeta sp.]